MHSCSFACNMWVENELLAAKIMKINFNSSIITLHDHIYLGHMSVFSPNFFVLAFHCVNNSQFRIGLYWLFFASFSPNRKVVPMPMRKCTWPIKTSLANPAPFMILFVKQLKTVYLCVYSVTLGYVLFTKSDLPVLLVILIMRLVCRRLFVLPVIQRIASEQCQCVHKSLMKMYMLLFTI